MRSIVIFAILLAILGSATAYSTVLALDLGYFSSAAYESAASIESWTCNACKRSKVVDVKVFSNSIGGIQGFTGYSQTLNAVIVCFRGSNNIQNWLINLSTTRSTYSACSGCSVHTGFLDGYNLVASAVRAAVNTLRAKYRTAKLMVTGHSLGGALAILAAADLKQLIGVVDQLYTFGQPRVGNAAFAAWFSVANTNRLIDYADIVPHVPPSNLGFVHTGKEIWYQRGMQTYQICSAQNPSCSNSIGASNLSTDDHNLDNYLKLKTVSEDRGFLAKLLDIIRESSLMSNLRQTEQVTPQWAAQQERQVSKVIQRLRQEQTIKVSAK